MIGDRIIEIRESILMYDGCFAVEIEYNGNKFSMPIYLRPAALFQILENEGLDSFEKIEAVDFYSDGLKISKTSLLFEVFDGENESISFLTSEEAEHYQYHDIRLVFCDIKTHCVLGN
jgi:hypothetical protein